MRAIRFVTLVVAVLIFATSCGSSGGGSSASIPTFPVFGSTTTTFNTYAGATIGRFAAGVRGVPRRVYVPNSVSNTVDVVDPTTLKVVSFFPVAARPLDVVPARDLRTLYVNSDLGNMLTPIDPRTGHPGAPIPVTDPYSLYFTPDGFKAVVVVRFLNSLDFRDPRTWKLIKRLPLPCRSPNQMDFAADGRDAAVSCDGSHQVVHVDTLTMRVIGALTIAGSSPQDVRLSPDGKVFYVADQSLSGVDLIDAGTFTRTGFIHTGAGAHGLYPSRDTTSLYVSNRTEGTISAIDFATRKVRATWTIPRASPDMGGVSANGDQLWLSGRFHREVYVINTHNGRVRRITVGDGPHGLCVFPQPGEISLGHTGNYR